MPFSLLLLLLTFVGFGCLLFRPVLIPRLTRVLISGIVNGDELKIEVFINELKQWLLTIEGMDQRAE